MKKEVSIVTLIRTYLTRRGNGKEYPIRIVEQYWDLDGELIFEIDPVLEAEKTKKNI